MPTGKTNRPKSRKTRKRAVLQFRIAQTEYKELAKEAAKKDMTISEVAATRLLQYPNLKRFCDASERFVSAVDRRLLQDAAFHLSNLGYRKMSTRDLWLGPTEPEPPVFSHAELEELLTRAAELGADRALKNWQK